MAEIETAGAGSGDTAIGAILAEGNGVSESFVEATFISLFNSGFNNGGLFVFSANHLNVPSGRG